MIKPKIDRRTVMRNAHRLYKYARMRGWTDWPFDRCLRFAWAEEKGRAALRMAA
jgi:hypothetical protein